jgi:uncharacterized protein DUF4431
MHDTDRTSSVGRCCLIVCSVLLALSSSRAEENRTTWLHFEPTVVKLTGIVGVAYEYSPPNWGDDPKSDKRPETPILRLSKPINVLGDPRSDINRGDAENVEEVQLQLDKYRGLVGKRVIVTGTLYRGHTGWHFTEVVMMVKSIRKAPKVK